MFPDVDVLCAPQLRLRPRPAGTSGGENPTYISGPVFFVYKIILMSVSTPNTPPRRGQSPPHPRPRQSSRRASPFEKWGENRIPRQ
eukprot:858939-Prorocentrum_minimum.AAC.1